MLPQADTADGEGIQAEGPRGQRPGDGTLIRCQVDPPLWDIGLPRGELQKARQQGSRLQLREPWFPRETVCIASAGKVGPLQGQTAKQPHEGKLLKDHWSRGSAQLEAEKPQVEDIAKFPEQEGGLADGEKAEEGRGKDGVGGNTRGT